jgi:coxsackievirus/adenovirus receptor
MGINSSGDQLNKCLVFRQGMCKAKKCSFYSNCFVDNRGKARCICPDEHTCPQVADAVCGTDGKTYLNDCVMKARTCKKGVLVKKAKDGACGKSKFEHKHFQNSNW